MKVSVIIPVYNCAPYLAATLASLQAQTMTDFEVLLVDDHGTDNSIEVARQMVADDARFRFLQTPVNSGPGVARNVGIEAAQGEYIAFVDGDDLVAPTFLEQLYAVGEGHDLCYCQLQYRGGKQDGRVHRNPVLEAGAFTADKRKRFLMHFVTYSVCFLFRRGFLTPSLLGRAGEGLRAGVGLPSLLGRAGVGLPSLRFPQLRNSEDTNFLTRCLLLAQSIACVDAPLYIYCVREASLSTGRNKKKYQQRLAAVRQLRESYQALCTDARYASLNLKQYRWVMEWLFFKKGYAQAFIDWIKN